MHAYAQIRDGRVVAVTETAAPVDRPDMIPLASFDIGLLGKVYADGAFSDPPPPPPQVPASVTMRQARLALLGVDKLAAVEVAIESLPEPDKTHARIWWEYSGTVERANPLVNAIGGAVGLDAEALDALFTAAQSL